MVLFWLEKFLKFFDCGRFCLTLFWSIIRTELGNFKPNHRKDFNREPWKSAELFNSPYLSCKFCLKVWGVWIILHGVLIFRPQYRVSYSLNRGLLKQTSSFILKFSTFKRPNLIQRCWYYLFTQG